MAKVHAYLNFNGDCKQAFDFYQKVFKTELLVPSCLAISEKFWWLSLEICLQIQTSHHYRRMPKERLCILRYALILTLC